MKFRWKRTIACIAIGIPLIFLIMLFGTFGSLHIDAAVGNQTYEVNLQTIEKGAKDYNVDSNVWTALSDDAWVTISLFQKRKIESIELVIDFLVPDYNNKVQVYYSRGGEVKGDNYIETFIYNGSNIIMFDSDTEVKLLRLDLTSKRDVSFKLKQVTIHFDKEKQILFWIWTPVLIIAYSILVIVYINRVFLKICLGKKPRLKAYLKNAEQVFSLAYSDFRSRFSGSYLGIFWGILQPMATILLFWFVFQVGFRSNPIDDVPFILWLSAGMIPWNYFYDSWSGGTSTFVSYGYIVKKVVFNVEVLPVVKILASAILNVIFNLILLVIYILYGEFPGYHIIDMIYFSFCIMALSLSLSYITATLNVFIKDVGQFLGIVLQFLMWLTPMMWDYHMMESYSWFYKLNPLHYVINGYREALINGQWFFHHWVQMLWFWAITLCCFVCGRKLMRKMKLHFADVL